jgi:hypothetical protein
LQRCGGGCMTDHPACNVGENLLLQFASANKLKLGAGWGECEVGTALVGWLQAFCWSFALILWNFGVEGTRQACYKFARANLGGCASQDFQNLCGIP